MRCGDGGREYTWADTARVIVVLCERLGKVSTYAILEARPATPEEIKQWMEGSRDATPGPDLGTAPDPADVPMIVTGGPASLRHRAQAG